VKQPPRSRDNQQQQENIATINTRPTAADICAAIAAAETGRWIDPTDYPNGRYCNCELYDPEGERVISEQAFTAAEAMGLAWLNV
jgi:hypothetical protein